MYKCEYCGEVFDNPNKLGGHKSHCIKNPKLQEIKVCPFCEEVMLGKKRFTQHVNHCLKNPDAKQYKSPKQNQAFEEPVKCQYCEKLCNNLNSLKNHERLCKSNLNRVLPPKESRGGWPKGRPGWSKGLNKYNDERLAKCSESIKKYYTTHSGAFLGKHHSDETKKKLSDLAKEMNYQDRFGMRKSFEYNGVVFQSSYEMQVAISLDKNNIRWQKANRLSYVDNHNIKHYYTPDIYLIDYDTYLDPKNDFLIENINPHFGYMDTEKIDWVSKQNNVKILILNKNQLDWNIIKTLL